MQAVLNILFYTVVIAMRKKCCAPGCTANYDNTTDYISVFCFPSNEARRQQWIRRIPRADFSITKNTVICQRHFEKHFVITEDTVIMDGK